MDNGVYMNSHEPQVYRAVLKIVLLCTDVLGSNYINNLVSNDVHPYVPKNKYGVSFFEKTVFYTNEALGNFIVKIVFWDVSMDIKYYHLRKEYYKGASGAMIFFDFKNNETIDEMIGCLTEFLSLNEERPVVILGINANQVSIQEKIVVRNEIFRNISQLIKDKFAITYVENIGDIEKDFLTGIYFIVENHFKNELCNTNMSV